MDIYREQLLDHYRQPQNNKVISNPTHHAVAINPLCGDQIEFDLIVDQGLIKDIGFQSQSCAITTATASMVSDLLISQPISSVDNFTPEHIQELLGTPLSTSRINCAMVVIQGIKNALENNHV